MDNHQAHCLRVAALVAGCMTRTAAWQHVNSTSSSVLAFPTAPAGRAASGPPRCGCSGYLLRRFANRDEGQCDSCGARSPYPA